MEWLSPLCLDFAGSSLMPHALPLVLWFAKSPLLVKVQFEHFWEIFSSNYKHEHIHAHTHIHILTHSCIHTCMHTHLATPKLYSADLYHCIYHTMLPWYVITVSIPLTRLSAPIVKVYYTFILILRHLALCLASSWLSINNYWSIILTSLRFKLGKSLLWGLKEFVQEIN